MSETIPEEVMMAAREVAVNIGSDSLRNDTETIALALLARDERAEARVAELLKDPTAVRVNWMRGGINADSIIAEVERRCAETAAGDSADFDFGKALAECRDSEHGFHSGRLHAASAIRDRSKT